MELNCLQTLHSAISKLFRGLTCNALQSKFSPETLPSIQSVTPSYSNSVLRRYHLYIPESFSPNPDARKADYRFEVSRFYCSRDGSPDIFLKILILEWLIPDLKYHDLLLPGWITGYFSQNPDTRMANSLFEVSRFTAPGMDHRIFFSKS